MMAFFRCGDFNIPAMPAYPRHIKEQYHTGSFIYNPHFFLNNPQHEISQLLHSELMFFQAIHYDPNIFPLYEEYKKCHAESNQTAV